MHQANLSITKTPQAYKNTDEFLQDLQRALESDYGIELQGASLEEAGKNIEGFLRSML